ncbi:MAG: phosphatidylglycerol lysyltransferase domain-containing protein, partial [Propionibacteriaceae bacterium]|nr:phosphatidylglycerol lysyltransferase domain-containing protein [Propionibacteriaceae bacterium]
MTEVILSDRAKTVRKVLRLVAVVLLALIACKNMFVALPFRAARRVESAYTTTFDPLSGAVRRAVSFTIGVVILLLVYRLHKRVRPAWVAEVCLLSATIALQIVRYRRLTVPIVLVEVAVLVILLYTQDDFTRKADRITVRQALAFIAASAFLVVVNSTVGLYLMRRHFVGGGTVVAALQDSLSMLFLWTNSPVVASSVVGEGYIVTLRILNWGCVLVAIALLLKPVVLNPVVTNADRVKVRRLVAKYGQNPLSYLALEADKKYFFGRECEGVVAYTVVGDVFVVCGDVICADADVERFLREIADFADGNAYHILLVNATDHFAPAYAAAGFGTVKMGEDCCFRLADFSLKGAKIQKVRAAINRATGLGVVVEEYRPAGARDEAVERQIAEISKEWLGGKGGYELHFTVGGTGLKTPLDRRYFYAREPGGRLLGFVVFLPYQGGYMADVTRRRPGAPQGVLEKITVEAFLRFKDEGVTWGNLGLSPLYNMSAGDKATFTEKLFAYVYENMNTVYGFKQLHHAKRKFAPTDWVPRYLVFRPGRFSP